MATEFFMAMNPPTCTHQEKQVREPENWDPVKALTTYIETLFGTDEKVGCCHERLSDALNSLWTGFRASGDKLKGEKIIWLIHCHDMSRR